MSDARGLSTDNSDAVGQPTIAPRYLVEIEFDSGTVRLWSGRGSLTALGQTWTGTGRLGKIEPIKETQEIRANGLRFSLTIVPTPEMPNAPDTFLDIALTEEYQGRPCIVYQAMMNTSTLELIDAPFQRFGGYLDVFEDSEQPGSVTLNVTAENRLVDLEREKKRTYTPEDQKSFYPTDTFYDEVAALQNRQIVLK